VLLMHRLQGYGVRGSLLSLVADFLDGRSQRVMLPGGKSTWKPVLSGVPQGSVLGPLLFMVALSNRADHIYFHPVVSFFFYLFFIPGLISAVGDWMSATLPHMVWP